MAPLKTYNRTRKPLSTLQPDSISFKHRDTKKKRKKKITEERLVGLGLVHKSKYLPLRPKVRPRPTPVELTPVSLKTQLSVMLSACSNNQSHLPLFPQSFTDLSVIKSGPHENTFDRLLKTGTHQGGHQLGVASKRTKEDGVPNFSGSSSLEHKDTVGNSRHHYNLRNCRLKSKQLSFLRVSMDTSYSDDQVLHTSTINNTSVIGDDVGSSITSLQNHNQGTSTPLLKNTFFNANVTDVSPITFSKSSPAFINSTFSLHSVSAERVKASSRLPVLNTIDNSSLFFKGFESEVENSPLQALDTRSKLYPNANTTSIHDESGLPPVLNKYNISKNKFQVSEISKSVEATSHYTYENDESENNKMGSNPTSCSATENVPSRSIQVLNPCISIDLFDSIEDNFYVSEFSKSVGLQAASQETFDNGCLEPENSKADCSATRSGSSIETSMRSLTVQDNNCTPMKQDCTHIPVEEELNAVTALNSVKSGNMLSVENYVTLRNRRVQWCEASIEHSPLVNKSELCLIAEVEEDETKVLYNSSKKALAIAELKFSLPSRPTCKDQQLNCRKSLNKRRSLAIRRLSHCVVPGKQMGVPKPDSISFRDFHRISYSNVNCGSALPMSDLLTVNGSIDESSVIINNDANEDRLHQLSARNIVLQKCGQEHPVSFQQAYPDKFLTRCRKIGEGLYGEVFMWTNRHQSSVLKIIPIDGEELVNGERQKRFDEILSEIVITKELSDLRLSSKFNTSGFAEVVKIGCLQGRYPAQLIDQWDDFAVKSGTENDSPTMFNDEQLYIVLELANGGVDLEKFVFNSAKQALSALLQTAHSLAVAEKCLEFEHRDLHWGNVLVSKTKEKVTTYIIDGEPLRVATEGVQVTIIDYTLSRMTYEGCCIFNDLSVDPMLFESVGDYQFDIYRLMKNQCGNTWSNFEPYNNVLWIHYLVDKMINGVHYSKKLLKNHKAAMKNMQFLKDNILKSQSTVDCLSILEV